MDNKNLLNLVITLIVGIIITGAVLMPILSDAQTDNGEPTTYTNYMTQTNQYRYDYVDSVELTATASETDGIYYDYIINGQAVTLVNDYMIAILSDGFSLQIGSAGQFAYNVPKDPFATSTNPTPTNYPLVTLTMANGEWSLKGGDTELATGSYSWLVTYVENGRYVAHNSSVVGAYCQEAPKDFIVYGGSYTSGDLDTYYAYGNGVMSWGVSEYDVKLNWAATLVDGTTDIYQVTTCDVTVSDGENSETFIPYRCLYVYEVTGHATSGVVYDLLGIIPLLVIIGLVVAAAGSIYFKNEN